MTAASSAEQARDLLDEEVIALATRLRADVARALADDASLRGSTTTAAARARATVLARTALTRHSSAARRLGEAPLEGAREALAVRLAVEMLFGLGVLQLFVDDPMVENVDVNGSDEAFVTYADGRKERIGPIAASDDDLVATIRAAGARFGLSERRFDAAQPELDLRLPDGSRLSAVMAVTDRPVVDIRRHRLVELDLEQLIELGAMDLELAEFLSTAVRSRQNILISGAMNTGKTTLLRALAAEIPPEERIVTIEQSLELGLHLQRDRHPDCVAMEARPANTEGAGAIGMAQLVRRSLRMNASRVIVGEVLGDEIIPMLNAMSQGRSGSMGTIHADSSAGVFRRIASYAVQAPERLPLEAANLLVAGAVHFVVHLDAAPVAPAAASAPAGPQAARRRYVASVREVVDAEGPLVISNELWRPGSGRAIRGAPPSERTLRALGRVGVCPGEGPRGVVA